MCGRKTLTRDMQSIIEELAVEEWEEPDNYLPSYNIAPTQTSPILVYENKKRIVKLMKWGLIPSWSKDPKIGARMINARSETLLEKPSFRPLLPQQRCVVITDGYYEWQRQESEKTPWYIRHPEGKLFPMAGLWDRWIDPEGNPVLSYTIITTTPAKSIEFIHNRMPVILTPDNVSRWVDNANHKSNEVMPLLSPYPSEFEYYPVSTLVNSPRNNSEACVKPQST